MMGHDLMMEAMVRGRIESEVCRSSMEAEGDM